MAAIDLERLRVWQYDTGIVYRAKYRVLPASCALWLVEAIVSAICFFALFGTKMGWNLGPLTTQTGLTGVLVTFYAVTSLILIVAAWACLNLMDDTWLGLVVLFALTFMMLFLVPFLLQMQRDGNFFAWNQMTQTRQLAAAQTMVTYNVYFTLYGVLLTVPGALAIGYVRRKRELCKEK